MNTLMLLPALLLFSFFCISQDINNIQMPELVKNQARKIIRIPDFSGYKVLKCDFHMHTIFSDGIVWPTVRVDEAWAEGLDAIAITDHIENNPSKKFVGGDDNSSYEIALPHAKQKNLILIRAGEITRKMPPGHFNALFLSDVNKLDTSNFMDAFIEAGKQGAFIIWNHPGWKAQQPDTCKWWEIHTELLNKGLLHGVEVFNEMEYYPIALDWCDIRGLAYTAASDIHDISATTYNLEKHHRPMTLVLTEELSERGIKDALFAKRTIAWFGDFLAGKEEHLKAFFMASVSAKLFEENNRGQVYSLKNDSDIPFTLKAPDGYKISLPANSEIIATIPQNTVSNFEVANLLIGSHKKLNIGFPFKQ